MTTGNSVDPIAQFVSYAVVVCWFLFALTFLVRKRPPRGQVTRRDQMALIGIGLQVAASFCVWFRPLQRQFYSPIIPMPQWAEVLLAVLTLAIAAFSIWLVNAAVRRLGKQWAVSASLVEGHKLVVDGPYHLVRNPIYTGIFGMLIATGLAVSRWNWLLLAVVVFASGTYIRVRIEERLLREAFGSKFDEYARKVPALIPGIY